MDKDVTKRIKERFIIIYDKVSHPIALSLRNSITEEKESCVVWTKKTYDQNESKLTNHNLLVLLNEKMIKEHLANPIIKTIHFSDGVILKHERNTMGIMVDPELDYNKYAKLINNSWRDYVVLLGGLIPLVDKKINERDKIKTKLLFDAAEKLKAETIERFLSGKQLG